MAITAVLVEQTPFRLRYLCTHDGQAGNTLTIPNADGATPDLATDAVAGPLKEDVIDRTGLTQAGARAYLNSDDAARTFLTNHLVGRAVLDAIPRSGGLEWFLDCDVVGGRPVILVSTFAAAAAECVVDVFFRNTPEL
jgi:hypothetical protein